ncbi:TadE/TadG family type IV pilus assembly protein [Sneathiella sp. HT1-7]|uniref:TadE/TadG family type IV pilus assembly protein n=1 Tax=Sneathiella sp. HT1-7 TaxID=2887192 RepID=UPI001D15A239|nr:TadE/TadG family type IV pilus assembly protein [Sneathiella sp. HT1-7]MCC3305675.1 pilus assembly protein [Sneathiella sp. HT1-7]
MSKKYSFDSLRRFITRFSKNNQGVSAVIIAFLAIPLFGAIGLSIDLGRAYVLKSKLSTALDAAGLAVGRNIFAPTDAEIYADAQKYFDANFPSGFMGTSTITMDSSTVTWDSTRENISLNVRADLGTTFMNVLGQPSLAVGAVTEIKRDNRGMELVLVLDNTGSMDSYLSGSTRMTELKSAAKNLVDILYGNDETKDKLWVGIVPYTMAVNVGPQNIDWLKNSYKTNLTSNSASIFTQDSSNTTLGRDVTGDGVNDTVYGWEGCVEMRDHLLGGTVDTSDDPPDDDFVPYFWNDYFRDSDNDFHGDNSGGDSETNNDWKKYKSSKGNYYSVGSSTGPNKYCPTSKVLPLTAEKSTIKSHIDSMDANGGTAVNLGMVWGWRALSPHWRGEWYGSSTLNLPTGYSALPLNYGEEFMDKVVVLMTDGLNTLGTNSNSYDIYHAYARQELFDTTPSTSKYDYRGFLRQSALNSSSYSSYPDIVDDKVLATCSAMKSAGVIVYTVLLVDGNSTMMRDCATSPKHAFVATSADELADNFNTIGEELSNLRISK